MSSRDGMNEREQVRGEHGGTNEHGGYERAREGTNAAGAVAGAMRPTSPSPPPPLPPFFFLFLYYLNIFTYFYVHVILYLEYFNEK
jgi:hypothetical protein